MRASLDAAKDAVGGTSPQLSAYYQHVTKAEKTGEREITFTFDAPGNRELPQIVGEINVLPKHWYESADKSGKMRDISATSLEPPLGVVPQWTYQMTPPLR
jgi:microcin C transport system substrate-binding protein